ncbi:type I 3-dehydroquinase-domain-containing protein [Penicillium nucicola]|uniref:type I 3-dehydroquinase-domain-containing protein n=1 Tax=Penicillium nucicola TaxID=1850975 RepID=UPI002544DC91|nr:type I 3-dehydroquinase-domain-containing protein [Penicillium nucicola]KAJ5767417.1 type I 3-dehydroquinase-domain-containing protein [Penicillium nucicola]
MEDDHAASPSRSTSTPSIVLIGLPGCGKKTLAFIGALHLGKRLVTAERYFETATGLSRNEFLQKNGKTALQQQTISLVLKMLRENETDCIIECGTSTFNRDVKEFLVKYKETHPVIHIRREHHQNKTLLQMGEADAGRLQEFDHMHSTCASFQYFNLADPGSTPEVTAAGASCSPHHLKEVKADFCHFLDLLTGSKLKQVAGFLSQPQILSSAVEKRHYTYALVVKLSEFVDGNFDPAWFESGADAIQMVIDMKDSPSTESITKQIAVIRRLTKIPIVYEVVEESKWNIDTSRYNLDGELLRLISDGFQNCVEYTTVNIGQLSPELCRGIISWKRRTKVIGCSHNTAHHYLCDKHQEAEAMGCDLVRLTEDATGRDDEYVQVVTGTLPSDQVARCPLISYYTGSLGRRSQIFNQILTPVWPATSARATEDHYLTAKQAMEGLFATFVYDSLKFYHFGASVSWSPYPPAMHQAAYRELGLKHSYQVYETNSLFDIDTVAYSIDFGGASISLPFKSAITFSNRDVRSPHATAIGAVNTLLPLRSSAKFGTSLEWQASQRNRAGKVTGWYGDNTDWLGILECVSKSLSPRNTIKPSKTTALVIGAGGAARAAIYALIQMGCRRIFIFNRTVQHAESVAAHFNSWMKRNEPQIPGTVSVIQSIGDPWPADIQPATIIISCIPAHSIDGQLPANLTLPNEWLRSKSGGVVAESPYISYKGFAKFVAN